jgi:hypothetical protein
MASSVLKKAPIDLLHYIANDLGTPIQIRVDAMKALLPYTAKKTAETLETKNLNYSLKDERLSSFTDAELTQFHAFLSRLAEPSTDSDGTEQEETQHD